MSGYFFYFNNIGVGLVTHYDDWRQGDPPIPSKNEIVMPADSTIEATTNTGKIIIRSGKGLKRWYTWDGATSYVVMSPRNERWNGSLGLIYPGMGSHWFPAHEGISRGVLEEGQQHFRTIEEAMNWLNKQKEISPLVYSDYGLVVSHAKYLPREQLNVDVWQILIDGKKPERLIGSNNSAIHATWVKAKP